MEKLKEIQKTLIRTVYEGLDHLDCIHTEELGEVIDMIKDLSETMYYCSIVKAMEHGEDVTAMTMMHESNGTTIHHVVE